MKGKYNLKLLFVLLVILSLSLISCNKSSNINNIDEINEKAEEKQKYIIELNLDNINDYIELRLIYDNRIYYYYDGAIEDAIYDNVNITYYIGDDSQDTKTIKLSKGGYYFMGQITMYNFHYVNITGKVIYWI